MLGARPGLKLLLTVVILTEPLRNATAGDWPQWRGLNRDGSSPDPEFIDSASRKALPVRWRFPVGRGWSSPVVARGSVFVMDAQLKEKRAVEHVYCLHAESGQLEWTFSYDAGYPEWMFDPGQERGPAATPVIAGSSIYTLGNQGHVTCLDLSNGAMMWQKHLAKDYAVEESNTYSSPLVEGDLLILMVGGEPNATVVALNKNTGEEVWKALDEPGGPSSPIVITAGGTRQLIVWTPKSVTSLDPRNGKVYWTEPMRTPGSQAVATPVFHNNLLLISGLMLRLEDDRPSAGVLWPEKPKISQRILSKISSPIFRGDFVYSANDLGELVCLEATTGKQFWTTNKITELAAGSCIHIASVPDGELLFTDQGKLIRTRLTPTGYQEISRTQLIAPIKDYQGRKVIWTPPALSNGFVFARDEQKLICCSLTE